MGRTTKVLNVLVLDRALYETPEVQALIEKGHSVECVEGGADLVIGSKCWRMTPAFVKYLDLAVREARGVRYGKEEK